MLTLSSNVSSVFDFSVVCNWDGGDLTTAGFQPPGVENELAVTGEVALTAAATASWGLITSAALTKGCSSCLIDGWNLVGETTTGLGTGIGALPTGGASIAVVFISAGGSCCKGCSMTCFDEIFVSVVVVVGLIWSFSTENFDLNTACDDGGGGCELGLLFSLSLLLLLLPKMLSLEFRLVKTADFRAKRKKKTSKKNILV